MSVEKQFLSVKARLSVKDTRLVQYAVLDAMNLRLVGTRWAVQSCDVTMKETEYRQQNVAMVTMIVQDYTRSPLGEDDRIAFIIAFERWCRDAKVTLEELVVRVTDEGPATESDGVPFCSGTFGREGLSR